jgi:oligopeptide transport system substrate-binding protein
MPGFNEKLSGIEFDADEALRLIKESSYGSVDNLPTITITTMGRGGAISGDMEAVIHQWKQNLGIQAEVRQLEPDRFLYHLKDEKDDLYEMGWIADYPHPQDFLEVLFRGDAEYNYGGYTSPEVNSLLDKAGLEMDGEKSLEMYREAERILVDEAACLPLYFGQNYTLVKPYVKGYTLNPMGIAALNRVYIER